MEQKVVSPTRVGMQKFGVQTEKGKVITCFRNGDGYQEEGARIVIHPTKFKTYDQLKVELNKKVGIVTGSIQKVYGMDKKLIKDLNDFQDNGYYICCGAEKLDDVVYAKGLQGIFGVAKSEQATSTTSTSSSEDTPSTTTTSTTSPVVDSKKSPAPATVTSPTATSVPRMFTIGVEKSKVIKAFRNGDSTHKGERIIVHPSKYKSFDQLKEELSKQVKLVVGAVRKLYTIDGQLVKGLDDLVDGAAYICCGGEQVDLNTKYKVDVK